MDKNSLLKEGLDKVNEGLEFLDKYLDAIETAATATQDEIKIALAIGSFCKAYLELCETVKKNYQKEV